MAGFEHELDQNEASLPQFIKHQSGLIYRLTDQLLLPIEQAGSSGSNSKVDWVTIGYYVGKLNLQPNGVGLCLVALYPRLTRFRDSFIASIFQAFAVSNKIELDDGSVYRIRGIIDRTEIVPGPREGQEQEDALFAQLTFMKLTPSKEPGPDETEQEDSSSS